MSMSYYDPYQDLYSSYEAYEEPSPPDPSEDWEDVPKTNGSYLRKIPRNIIQEQFKHLIAHQIYDVDTLVECIELHEYYIQPDDNVNNYQNIVVNLKFLDLPFADLYFSTNDGKPTTVVGGRTISKTASKQTNASSDKSVNRTVTRPNTVISGREQNMTVGSARSAMTLANERPYIPQYFQTLLLYLSKTATKARRKQEVENIDEEENNEQTEEGNPTHSVELEVRTEESSIGLHKIDAMRGKSVLLMVNGYTMMQKMESQDIRISVGRRVVVASDEEGEETTEEVPLGSARVAFPQTFLQAVLQQGATEQSFKLPLLGEQGEEVGSVSFIVKFASLGEGVEVTMSGDPDAKLSVKLMKSFPPEAIKSIFDPPVHPRLAVTVMNLNPPPWLNRTCSEIIRRGLDNKWILLQDEEGLTHSKINPRKCQWLKIAKEISERYSKSSFESGSSIVSATQSNRSKKISRLNVALPGNSYPDIRPLWREIKRKCVNLREETEEVGRKRKKLFEELEQLLSEDKGEGWEDEIASKTSKSAQEEDQKSSSSKRSRKSSLRKSKQSLRLS